MIVAVIPPNGQAIGRIGVPMTALNFSDYVAGDSLVIDVTVRDSTAAPVDLTGATLRWGVAPIVRGVMGAAAVTKVIADGIEIVSAAAGTLTITLDAGDIPDAGTYHHELEVTLESGLSYSVLCGRITAQQALFPSPPA